MSKHIELHVHPYFGNYSIMDLVTAVVTAGLDVVALERFNGCIYDEVRRLTEELKKYGYRVYSDDKAIELEGDSKKIYFLRATELQTSDGFHVLTIGHDNFQNGDRSIRGIIDQAIKKGCFVVLDHPFVNAKYCMLPVSGRRRNKIESVCKDYDGQIALEWNGYCLGLYWGLLRPFGLDANRRVLKFSEYLRQQGYNIPVVTGTDLHARNKRTLGEIGRARLIADIDTSSGQSIIQSLKHEVFSGSHKNTYRTVSLQHFIPYFMIPLFLEMFLRINTRSRG